ncbi:MAG: hypothetical protein UMV23_00795 [Halanaerobium sp.]|nr:hypothetical protein [Halanaerobium sp.]
MQEKTLKDRIPGIITWVIVLVLAFWGIIRSAIVANIFLYFGVVTAIIGVIIYLIRLAWKRYRSNVSNVKNKRQALTE